MFALPLYLQHCILGIQENKEGLELLKTAIEKAGYTGKVSIAKYFRWFLNMLLGCLVSIFVFWEIVNRSKPFTPLGGYWYGCCSF